MAASDRQQIRVDCHAHHGIGTYRVELIDSCWLRIPPATMSWPP